MRKFAVFEGLSSVQVVRFCGVRAKVDRDASRAVISLDVDPSGQLALSIDPVRDQLQSLEVNLSLKNDADAQIFIAVHKRGDEMFRCKTSQKHIGTGSSSRVDIHCAAEDQSRVDYRGEIDVPAGVSSVNAELRCRGLLLSDEAKVSALPIMKISSRDAECTHGVAVGGIDPELLMYYFSRGVDHRSALEQIVSGFLTLTER